MLISTIAGSGVVIVPTKAEPAFPWEPLVLYATKTSDPYWGYYGGYHDIWEVIKANLTKIGITLDTSQVFDPYAWWYRVWDRGWDKTHQNGGWDLTMFEWWLQPHSLVPWFESMVYGNMTPPEGYNIYKWNNTKADTLLRRAMQTSNALAKKSDIWKWQQAYMHDPPMADIYNPRSYEITASYIEGYNPSGCWWYDISHLTVNATKFYDVCVDAGRRAIGPNTAIYAVSETMWNMLPVYMDSYTEEQVGTVQWCRLYHWGIKPDKWYKYLYGADPSEIDPSDWAIVPYLAAKDPIIDPDGTGDTKKARVILRQGVTWSDGAPLTVHDVLFTFNTTTLNLAVGNTGYGDFIPQLKEARYYNETAVDFILQYPVPMVDLKSCLANDWGGGAIMPFHILKGYMDNPATLRTSKYNTAFSDPTSWIPVTGPFKMVECAVDDHVTFEKNPYYFGYDLGWGPYNINTLIYKWVGYAPSRFAQLKTNQLDFGEYPTGPVSEFKEWSNPVTHPNVRVFQYDYPATNGVWFNLGHPVISNRYVRLAIAHAIDYEYIFDNILPGWGIETAYRGLTHIMDAHYYSDGVNTVHLYNDNLQPYQTNTTQALKYMEMWWYSKDGKDKMKGPRGDSDFSGFVELDDFYIWVKWWGKTTSQITFLPGQDQDPDWDNSGYVEMPDFYEWTKAWGYYYPENSTTHVWSR